jgi:hypothetical protein
MHTGGFFPQWGEGGCWDRGGLYPANHGQHATTSTGHQAFAVTRPSSGAGVQGAKPEFWNGRRPYRSVFVEGEMTKITVLVALALALIAKTPNPGGSS